MAVSGNGADGDGGAIGLVRGSLTVSKCLFEHHYGQSGGAIFTVQSALAMCDTTFSTNGGSQSGGALFVSFPASFRLTPSSFQANNATRDGGAIGAEEVGEAKPNDSVSGSTFSGNDPGNLGGAIYLRTSRSY